MVGLYSGLAKGLGGPGASETLKTVTEALSNLFCSTTSAPRDPI